MPDVRYISHHERMIEFDGASREALFIITKTTENLADLKRPDLPFLSFERNTVKNLRIVEQRTPRIPGQKKVFLKTFETG